MLGSCIIRPEDRSTFLDIVLPMVKERKIASESVMFTPRWCRLKVYSAKETSPRPDFATFRGYRED